MPKYARALMLIAALIGGAVSIEVCGSPATFGGAYRVILGDPGGHYHAVYWRVPRGEAERADRGVRQFLLTQTPSIAARYSEYYGQVVGTTDASGRKLIHLNYFCPDQFWDESGFRLKAPWTWGRARWTYELVEVEDGGECFFHLDFDPATGRYENFGVNGEA